MLPKRKHNRLPTYNYSACGTYFITICTFGREEMLWAQDVGAAISRPPASNQEHAVFHETPSAVPLSAIGQIVDCAVCEIPQHYHNVRLDHYAVMPNHIHLLLSIIPTDGRLLAAPTISQIVGQFKRHVSKKAGRGIWQKSFHDHIVRSERDYQKIWEYIEHNPWHWETDCFYSKTR